MRRPAQGALAASRQRWDHERLAVPADHRRVHRYEIFQAKGSEHRQGPLQQIPGHFGWVVARGFGVGYHHPTVRQPDAGEHRPARGAAAFQTEWGPPAAELVEQVRPNGDLVDVAVVGHTPATLQRGVYRVAAPDGSFGAAHAAPAVPVMSHLRRRVARSPPIRSWRTATACRRTTAPSLGWRRR